jgi:hypothetical protein
MAKLYSKTPLETSNNLKPKKETISFLLNYSKALSVIKSEKKTFELVLN